MTTMTIEKSRKAPTPALRVPPERIGLGFQGGSFLAGALSTGVVKALIERQIFDRIGAFSGTSAGALVAAMCWKHQLAGTVNELPEQLKQQWLANATGVIPNQQTGDFLKLLDRQWSLNPFYFHLWKELMFVPKLHQAFERWVADYVQPKECMQLLYERYVQEQLAQSLDDWRDRSRSAFNNDERRTRLLVSTTEIHRGEIVVIDDEDLFDALLEAFEIALSERLNNMEREQAIAGARSRAIEVGAEYMSKALMASGSLDDLNGMTRIEEIQGLKNIKHKGHYLDGAWAENPPMKELIDSRIDEIWMVEVFPKKCESEPETHEARQDRKEELWQDALVEQQLYFIRKVNLWLQSERLLDDGRLQDLRQKLIERLNGGDVALLEAFNNGVAHPDYFATSEAKAAEMTKVYRPVTTRCIHLPTELQPLTAGARIVNSPGYLVDKMDVGYASAMRFVSDLPYTLPTP